MSLKGGKLIWFNKKDKREKIIKLKNKRNFKFGYYMTNDFILENPKSKPVQCEIVADAFNRISIVNCSKQNPISLNGFPVKTRRPLLHGNKIKIFDEEFVWQFPKNGKNRSIEAKKNNEYEIETPIKNQYECIPAPSSEPWKKRNRERIRARLSAHSFVQNQGNETSEESDQDTDEKNNTSVQITKRNTMINRESNINELSKQLKLRRTFDYVTPVKKWDDTASLIKFDTSFSQNKENTRTNSLQLCKSSGTLVTSYSPQIQNDPIKANSSFAYVKSAKNTPKSVYCTPKSVLSELGNDQDIEMDLDLINFSTPRAKYIENTGSMFLIDLTTPAQTENKIKSPVNKTPINVQVSTTKKLKSVLKNPNANDVSKSVKKVKMSLGNKERSPLQVNERNSKRLKLSASPSPTSKPFRKSLSLSCTKIVKNDNQINFTPNKAALSLENSKNFPKVVDLSDAEKINTSNKIVQGSFSSFETIDNTINLDDGSTVQEGHESSVIEVSDDSNNISLKSLNNSLNNKSLSQKQNETPNIQNSHKTPQSLMKKVLLSSARKVANNSLNSPAILNTASTPIHVKKLSVSFDSSGNGDRKLSNIERKSTRFSLNSSLVSTTPSSNRKSIKSNSLIKNAPLNRSIKNIDKSNITTGKQRKSIYEIFNKDETQKLHTPKRHSCGNTKLAASLLTPTEMKSNKKMSRNSTAILNFAKLSNKSLQSKITNKSKSTVIENHKNEETLTSLPKLNQIKSSHINNTINIIEKSQANFRNDKVFENSALNETFSIDSDSENLETQQSDENLSMTSSENKVFKSLTKNRSSDIEKDMKTVKKNLEPNKENIEYETNIQETLKLKNSNNAEKNIPIKNRKKVSNPKGMSTPKMDGIKHLMSTPKIERTPIFEGLKETLKTPKLKTSNTTNAKSERSSLKTLNFTEDAVNLSGIQELLKTPDETENKIEKINNSSRFLRSIAEEETEGLDSIFKTPSAKTIMVSEKICQSTETKKYLNSASENVLNPSIFEKEQEIEVDNPDPLFDTSLQNFQSECVSTPRTTLDTTFDKLLGKRSTTKSYSNKKSSTKKEFTYIIDVNNSAQNVAKSDIQEWVENITLTNLQNFEKSENNAKVQNISSDSDAINVSGIDILNISCKTEDSVDESSNDNTTNTGNNNSTRNIKKLSKSAKGKKTTEEEFAFENFKEKPELISQKSLTPNVQRKKSKNNRKTMGNNQIMSATFDFKGMKEQREKEIAFENFTDQPKLIIKKSFTPEIQKIKSKIPRKTLGNNDILNTSFDLKTAKEQREKEIAFENFEEQPNLPVQKSFTPDVQKAKSRITRKTMGNNQIMDASFDLETAKKQREKEIAFENFEEQPNLPVQKSFTPNVQKTKSRITRKTMGNNQFMDASFDLDAAKEQREKEIAFENFEEQPNLPVKKSFTPDVQKAKSRIARKTMGNKQIMDASFDLETAKEQREKEIEFENFEEQPNLPVQKSFTPNVQKTKSRISRKTMGNNQIMDTSFDLKAAKEQRKREIAFENFEEQPNLFAHKSFTPDVQKAKSRITRKTMGNNQIMDTSFGLEAAKEQREKEIAFENFEEQPNLVVQKSFTPDVQKAKSRITRKTMGNNQIMDTSFDLEAAKEQREKEIVFRNFEEQPNLFAQKSFTPDVQKVKSRFTRKTMGNNQIMDTSFDLETAKEQREKEIAFGNFEERPTFAAQKSFTPDVQKAKSKITRKTMGNNQIMDTSFDLEAAKEQREREIAFENFEEQSNLFVQKSFTPDVQKAKSRITRKTMGNNQIMDTSFDLESAKEQREKEIAFENFEEQPNLVVQKSFTPNVQKTKSRITRKTMGNNQIMDTSFDMEAAKEQKEKEIAFGNFEDISTFVAQKSFTPDVQKVKSKITRRTMGNNQIMDTSFDLEAAKEQREREIAFENFEEQPNLVVQKSFTPNVKKTKSRITRKTMGNNQIMDTSFDLEAAKEQREKEIEFENFEEQPNLVVQKSFTPNVHKTKSRITRKTMGNNQIMDTSFDLEAAKEQREKEIAFENFEERPNLFAQKSFTPDVQKAKSKIIRKTMGNNQIMDTSFNLEAAKEQREKEIAFENFEEQPNIFAQKSFTPDVQKAKSKIIRKTMGNNQIMDTSFNLEAAKEQREKEIAFENFEEQPNLVAPKSFTPDVQKVKSRTTRKTMGNNQIMDTSFDLESAKEQREKEIAFENFEEQPNLVVQKSFTPNVQKTKSRITRKTMGNNQIMDTSFDMEAAKEQREKEIAFENFEEQPNLVVQKSFTPNVQKTKSRITRKTMGNNQIMDTSFDLEAAKEQREKEIAFENFEEQPNLVAPKSFTPDVQKVKSRFTRKTMGNNQIMDTSFDLETAKEQREKEIAFGNFEERPTFVAQKSFTPNVQKAKSKITRKTMGNNQIMDTSFDLEAAKEQREREIAFENFEEQPNLFAQKSFTPDVQKAESRITRKTMGNNQIMDTSFDIESAKEQREKEIAFENFEEQPNLVVQKSFTPNVQKTKSRITRKTMGNNQIMDTSFDLEAAKEQREKEIAFENFEERPNLFAQKSFTPDVQKAKSRITRKTMGNNQIMDTSFDLESAKEQREKEIAFENFVEQPYLVVQKSFTPEVQKAKSRITRKTMGNNQIMDTSFDLEAAKEQREKEIVFQNFEEQPNLFVQKSFTPDVQKVKSRFTRKTMGNNQIMDTSFDLDAAIEQREKEIAFENFEEQPNLVAPKSFTPDVQKVKSRTTRKTMGNNHIMDASFDLEAVKEQRNREIAFENFKEQPDFIVQKSFTPDDHKKKSRNARNTMGNNQSMDTSFDWKTAKAQKEKEIAFEHFVDKPKITAQKSFTPQAQKTKSKIPRKTMGNNQMLSTSFNLETQKERREMELAFKNFDDHPKLISKKSFTPEVLKAKSRFTRKTMGNNHTLDLSFDLQAAKEQRERELNFEKENIIKGRHIVSTKMSKDFPNVKTTEEISISSAIENKIIDTNTEIWSISSESDDNRTLEINNKKVVGINEFSKSIEINSDKGKHLEFLEAELLEKNAQNKCNNSKRLKKKRQSKKQVNVNIHIDSESEFQNGGELVTVEYESLETKENSLSNIEIDSDSEIESSFKENCVDDQIDEQNLRENNNENRVKVDNEVPFRTTRRTRTQKKDIAQLDRKELKEARKSDKDSENVKTKTPEIRLRRVRFISNVENDSETKDSAQSNILESDSSNQTHLLELNTNIIETKKRGRRGQKNKIDHLKSIENLIVKETEKNSLTDSSTTILISKTKELENNFTTDSDNKTSPQTKINRRRRIKEKELKREDIKDIELDSNPIKSSSKTRRQREKLTVNSLKSENHLNTTSEISEGDIQIDKNTESDSDVKIILPTVKVRRLRNTKLKQLEPNTGSDITDVPNSSIESSESFKPNNQLDYKLNKTMASTIVDSGSEPEKYRKSKLRGRQMQKLKTVESKSNENILQEENIDTVIVSNYTSPKVKGRRGRLRRENNSETSVKILNMTNESKETTNVAESAGSDNAHNFPHSSIEHSENFEANYLLGYKLNKTPNTEIIDSSSESDKNRTTSKLRGLRTQKPIIVESKSNEMILKAEQNTAAISGLNKVSPKIKVRRGRTRKDNSKTSLITLNLTNEPKATTNLVASHSSESLEHSEAIKANSYSGVNKKTKTTKSPVRNTKESDSESKTTRDSSESLGESEFLIESNINKNKIPIETKKRRGRAAKAVKTESIESNNLLEKQEVTSNFTETEKSGMDVDSNSESHRTPPKTRRNLRQKKVDETKESIQTPPSVQEPIFKTPSSLAPKSRAARRLRSNSTSTPVMLDDNSIEHGIKIEMPGRRLRSNSITTLIIDESLPLVSEVEKDKDSDAEVNKTSPKIRGRRRRKIELNDAKIETDVSTIQKECLPIRTARRLRSNSTTTPIVLDESLTSIEKLQIEEKVSDKDHPKSTVLTDENLMLSEIDAEDNKISTRKTGRSRRNAKNILQPKIIENVDIIKVSKDDSQDEKNDKFLKNIKKDFSETPDIVEMEIENEIKIAATKATRTRTNKRKLYESEEQSNDSEPGPVIERRTTRRRK